MAEVAARPHAGAHARRAAGARQLGGSRLMLGLPAGLALVGLLLRLHNIDREPLWLDEGYTLLFSRLPFDRLILIGGAHEHPPLYYSIVHLLLAIHDSYLVPRYVSAAAGAASVVVIYLLGSYLFGRIAGLVSAILLAISPFHIWFSQDGRGYELAGLFVLLSYLLLFKALDRPRRQWWVLYACSLALSLYGEYTTLFVLLPQAVLLFRAGRRGLRRPLVVSWLAAGVLFTPWLGTLLLNIRAIAGDYWIPVPTTREVSNTVLEFLGLVTPCPSEPCTGTQLGLPGLAGHEIAVAAGVALIICAAGVAFAVRRDLEPTVLVLWIVLPFALVLLLAVRRSLYLDRVFLDATFPLYLLLGLAVARHARLSLSLAGGAGAAAALLIAGASTASLAPIYAGGSNPDWRSAGRDFSAAYRQGQAVVFNPGVLRSLISSYLPAGWHATYERPLWSRTYVDVPGWQTRFPAVVGADKRERQREEAILRNYQLGLAARGRNQVWLITYDYPGMNDCRRWFSEHGFQPLVSETYGGDTRIELWDRRPPASFGPVVVPASGLRGWRTTGQVHVRGGVATARDAATLSRSFDVAPGGVYSVSVDYRGMPPASKPLVLARVYDHTGHVLGIFPRTQWYDFPVNGVWLSQPFGFVAPPGAVHAAVTLSTSWGESQWRNIAVYRERTR